MKTVTVTRTVAMVALVMMTAVNISNAADIDYTNPATPADALAQVNYDGTDTFRPAVATKEIADTIPSVIILNTTTLSDAGTASPPNEVIAATAAGSTDTASPPKKDGIAPSNIFVSSKTCGASPTARAIYGNHSTTLAYAGYGYGITAQLWDQQRE